jgi:hypothetical protein
MTDEQEALFSLLLGIDKLGMSGPKGVSRGPPRIYEIVF